MNSVLKDKKAGLSGSALGLLGLILVISGALGRTLFENKLYESDTGSTSQMSYALLAVLLQALSRCAVPIFVFLLFKAEERIKSPAKAILVLTAVAFAAELPYDLVMHKSFFEFKDSNPVFALSLCLAMLYFFRRYEKRRFWSAVLFGVVTFSALLWAIILSVAEGVPCVILCALFHLTRKKEGLRPFLASAALSAFSLISPFYMLSPLSLALLHFYDGERA